MFCSNCGKTLKPDATSCPNCGAVVGESRFDGHPYTGAQVRTKPGEAVRLPGNHTRTTYMGSNDSENADVDARTTYRATNGGVPSYDEPKREPLYNSDEASAYEEEPSYGAEPDEAAEETFDEPAAEAPETEAVSAEPQPEPEPPVMDLDDLSNRQFAFDSWAAADLDETSAGMPALNVPVNPLFAASETHDSNYNETAAYDGRFDAEPRASRIETENYEATSSDYDYDPFAAAPVTEHSDTGAKAASASSYTRGTDDERFDDYHTEDEPPRFSEFSQAAKIVFIALVVALLGVIAFEGFQLFRGPTQAESQTQQKEDDNEYLDINTLKGDPNDGDE